MKVLFLDIDGVLCTARACEARRQRGLMQTLDPVGVGLVDWLLRDSGAKLVLSSTWRLHHDQQSMTAILQNAGLAEVPWHSCWKTPESIHLFERGQEIKLWMVHNGTPEQYVILDDDTDMLPDQLPFYVQTCVNNGIRWRDYELARKILGAKSL